MDLPRPRPALRPGTRPSGGAAGRRRHAALGLGLLVLVVLWSSPAGAAALVAAAADGVSGGLTWWKAAILGVVEGVTEFLPISSTGHLLVTQRLLGLGDSAADTAAANTYAIAIQFGAIVAVAGLFWRRFVEMLKGLAGRSPDGRRLLVNLVVAFLPAAVVGFLFDDKIEELLFGPWPIIAAWAAGGVLILVLEWRGLIPARGEKVEGRDPVFDITLRQSAIVGAAQVLAMWPGTSRSFVTILAALLVGMKMVQAVEFSFLLGFLTLTAASGYSLLKDGDTLVAQFGLLTPLVGALFALVSAVLAIRWMLTYLEQHSFSIFGWYRIGAAVLAAGMVLGGVLSAQ
ncbi:MAG: undecaprenyl-diphosphate phosphatase [Actinomycetes bacterium]